MVVQQGDCLRRWAVGKRNMSTHWRQRLSLVYQHYQVALHSLDQHLDLQQALEGVEHQVVLDDQDLVFEGFL